MVSPGAAIAAGTSAAAALASEAESKRKETADVRQSCVVMVMLSFVLQN
jgi:hypothetical protein